MSTLRQKPPSRGFIAGGDSENMELFNPDACPARLFDVGSCSGALSAPHGASLINHLGLRHLALKVSDVERARDFYQRVFGMKVVWQPDPDNVYLSSGCDNLALHRGVFGNREAQALDHLGFIVPTLAEVEAAWEWAQRNRLDIVHPLRHHRDGSVSFYIRDPDGNVVQLLYEPAISPKRFA